VEEIQMTSPSEAGAKRESATAATYAYDEWLEGVAATGVPVYGGHGVTDVDAVAVAPWAERGTQAAFIKLEGQQGISEARVTHIEPGESQAPYRVAIDEIVYVASGNGLATVQDDAGSSAAFEWAESSLFVVPRNTVREFSNLRGDRPARLLHYNFLPLAMSVVPEAGFFLGDAVARVPEGVGLDTAYDEAQRVEAGSGLKWIGSGKDTYWLGNFFPDLRAWDKLEDHRGRGAGGGLLSIQFAGSEMGCHMSVFPPGTYKKAHRHGPGRVIVIPDGVGYTLMWREGDDEKVIVPWGKGSIIVPPDRWFHQHFNTGAEPARYLAFHPPLQFHGYAAKASERKRDQIEYVDEDPWVREHFEQQLAERGLTSLMPAEAYTDPRYVWKPAV
jgi:oxalate decarboxylase/phosphoglucose isomerase-like protein (cupin superfamily)